MKFKCKISDLMNVSRLVLLKGKNIDGKEYHSILDALIIAENGFLKVKAMDVQKSFAVQLDYKIDSVIESGPLPIGDLIKFEELLHRFNPEDDVTVSTFENKIVIERENPKKILRIPFTDTSKISSYITIILDSIKWSTAGFPYTPKSYYNLRATVNAEKINEIIEDGNVIKQRILPWKIENGKLYIKIGSETLGEFETEITFANVMNDPEKSGIQKTGASFGNGIDNIFGNLVGPTNIYLVDGVEICPLVVEQKTEKYSFLSLLAPYAKEG